MQKRTNLSRRRVHFWIRQPCIIRILLVIVSRIVRRSYVDRTDWGHDSIVPVLLLRQSVRLGDGPLLTGMGRDMCVIFGGLHSVVKVGLL